jgi:hypothetical protein
MPTTLQLRDGLTPKKVEYKYNHKREPVKSLISDFIKQAEINSQRRGGFHNNSPKPIAEDRRHVKDMLPFEGSTDVAVGGQGDYGLFNAIYECYNNHWGLRTVPDDWWYTIIRTVAIAIDEHSKEEKVRTFFVNHEGKKRLTVDVDDTCGIDYEKFFREMTDLIQSNIKIQGYVDAIRSDFSTSTATHRIVSEITVMSSMQEFFEYCMRTMCGVPFVELEGEEEDWVNMKRKLVELKVMLEPIHETIGLNDWWGRVERICDKLIETSRGNGDKEWWGYVLSHQRHGMGSGSYVTYDGWFLRDLLNISKSVESFGSIPSGLVSVPLVFDENGVESDGVLFQELLD